jgi:predicted RNase H-like nuclease (RuvC/YqgF family)
MGEQSVDRESLKRWAREVSLWKGEDHLWPNRFIEAFRAVEQLTRERDEVQRKYEELWQEQEHPFDASEFAHLQRSLEDLSARAEQAEQRITELEARVEKLREVLKRTGRGWAHWTTP